MTKRKENKHESKIKLNICYKWRKGSGYCFERNIKDPKYTDRVDTHKRPSSDNAALKRSPTSSDSWRRPKKEI